MPMQVYKKWDVKCRHLDDSAKIDAKYIKKQ